MSNRCEHATEASAGRVFRRWLRILDEREVRALPVIALVTFFLAAAVIVYIGRGGSAGNTKGVRHAGEPSVVRDVDHYVPGSPPAVAERFLRAWFRYRYDEARALSTGAMRELAEHRQVEIGGLNAAQTEEYRHTRVYVDATHYDLEHVEMRDLPATPDGRPRKEVRGQAHAYGAYAGTRGDSRRGQTFVLELVDGSWRVVERIWETFEREGG